MTATIAPPQKFTYEELRAMDDDTLRELHDGEIFEMPSPSLNHQKIIARIAEFLLRWKIANGGEYFLSPVDLHVSSDEYFIPDLCFYGAHKMASGQVERDPNRLTVAPDLIVEVISPSTARNDRVRKLRAYADFGVPFYWIVDPIERSFTAYELENGAYKIEAALEDGETLAPRLLPQFSLDVSEVLGPQN